MHQDFLRNAHGLLQSNTISTFKPTEPPSKGHLKFKLNNLHQKWSFCLDHFGITLDLPASNLLFAKPFWLPTHWFWASNFPSCRRLWKQCSRWCRTATRRQKSNTRRSKSASSNGDWQEIMDSINFVGHFVPQTCYTGYETGAAIRFHGAHCYLQWFLKPMGIIPELPLHKKLTYQTLKGWYGSLMKEVQQVQRTIEIRSSTTYFQEPSFVCMYVSAYHVCIYTPKHLHPNTLIVI